MKKSPSPMKTVTKHDVYSGEKHVLPSIWRNAFIQPHGCFPLDQSARASRQSRPSVTYAISGSDTSVPHGPFLWHLTSRSPDFPTDKLPNKSLLIKFTSPGSRVPRGNTYRTKLSIVKKPPRYRSLNHN